MEKLTRDELEGVLAHELSHVRNRDVLFATLVVALVGAVAIASELFLRSLWFRRGGDSRNPALLAAGVALAILAPVAARLVHLAISRQREYLADATGAHATRYPDALADALEKIRGNDGMEVNAAVTPLYLADPLKKKARALLSTHPSTNASSGSGRCDAGKMRAEKTGTASGETDLPPRWGRDSERGA